MHKTLGQLLDDMRDLQVSMAISQATIYVLQAVARLKLLDCLDDGPASAEEIADMSGLHGPSVGRVPAFLASEEVVATRDDGRYAHTERSKRLQQRQAGFQFLQESMIGGSHGHLMRRLLDVHRDARGIVFDRPETAAQTTKLLLQKTSGTVSRPSAVTSSRPFPPAATFTS